MYLRSFRQSLEVDITDVLNLVEDIELFALAAHFFWGVWALIQAAHSSIDFDFVGYDNRYMELFLLFISNADFF